ncbi:MAG: ABC transporter substrate-binding protein [Thiomargarita sp.]|nr:ABC transporter substrate-binding protein [Thiomargarita sp.]
MKTPHFILGIVLCITIIAVLVFYKIFNDGELISIAFVGPTSGEGKAAGQLMTNAIKLYLEKINKKGGINGKQVILEVFDDENDSKKAKQQALKIVKENRAVAVIGHWYSSASISAGQIYKKYEIPAITPGSTSIEVTKNNEWYFRNVYNAKVPGEFLANYVKNVFPENNVSIISEDGAYGSYLAQVFEKTSRQLGMNVVNHWHYSNDNNLDDRFKQIVDDLKLRKKEAGIILLAVQATEAVQLVKLIKDGKITNKIIGGSSLSEKTFRDGFDEYPKSTEYPGYYTNDIYVATPLMFDTANEKAQQFFEDYQAEHGEKPDDWSAAYAYDTIMVLVKAIKKSNIEGRQETLKADRQKIRDTLASFTEPQRDLEGITGFNYFDKNRDAQKSVSLGVYKRKYSVSAPTQLTFVRNVNDIADLKQLKKGVLQINNKYMYKTNVVYVGLDIIEISHIDFKNLEFTLEFKLWFRFVGDFNPQNIEIINAIEHKEIKQQLKLCKERKTEEIVYTVCRIKSRFKADFIDTFDIPYKQHIVGVNFRHQTLSRTHLIYVTDILGMGLGNEEYFTTRKNQVLNPTEGWKIVRPSFFPNIKKEYSAGDPEHLDEPDGMVKYSQFNTVILIKKDEFTLRGIISEQHAFWIMIVCGALFLLLTLLGSRIKKYPKSTWFFQVIFAFLFLLSGEVIFADWLTGKTSVYRMKYIISIFDILWWIIGAYLFNVAIERFGWTPLQKKIGQFPVILRHFVTLLVFSFALIGIIVFVFEKQFTSLLAASSVLVMIIGLAIQINISNVFAGIVINMERPFQIGDWVKISTFEEGEVKDINWRATLLEMRNGCRLIIPNSVASESAIMNFHLPDKTFWLWPTVYVHPRHSPERVKKILLDALLSTEAILREPKPIVFFTGINEWSAAYWIAFCADNYADKYSILEEVWTRVWFHLNRANIAPAVMRQEIHVFKGEKSLPYNGTPNDYEQDEK